MLKRSVCPYDCPDTCGIIAEIKNGQVVKVTGDPEHPYTQGFLCAKMAHYEKTVHSPQRLTKPLLRTGKKGEGKFSAISWDDAIDQITDRWKSIIAQYGAEAILPYSYAGTMGIVQRNCGEAFFNRLGASRLARTICSSAKSYGWSAVMGATRTPHPEEVKQSDLIILWGTNAFATNIHFVKLVRTAKKQGAAVWLIDTYENPTSAIADKTVLVRPGSDGALALGIMHILNREGWIDKEFISSHVQGFEKLQKEILPDYPPEKVSRITGVDKTILEDMAAGYAGSKTPFISLGSGLSRYGNGAMTVRTITCLPALVGAWRKPGGGLFANVSSGSAFYSYLVTREDFQANPTRIINMNQLGTALNELTQPPVMSLYVYHSNPAVIAPDQNMIIKGLLRDDLFTIVHERFLTDTARYADMVLPATSSLEQADIFRSYGHYVIQRASAVIPPVGESKSNWEVFQLLAQSLGFQEPYFFQSADDLINQLIANPTPWLEQVDLIRLNNGQPVELPLPEGYKTSFLTSSGKIEIYNPSEKEPLPYYLKPYQDNAPFYLMSTPSIYSLNSSFNERPDLVQKKENAYLFINPSDAQNRKLKNGQLVIAFNSRGEVIFELKITDKVPSGVLVTEGLFWNQSFPNNRSVNALTSQRLTDQAEASTLYDVKVDIRPFEEGENN
ncbi:MAG: molybdopterin-dependent oxidoreductase [Peptococcaceae bacterium]|nr:molybdopterin-dependent oxidoreductase [Peptococcaceae bacterium]